MTPNFRIVIAVIGTLVLITFLSVISKAKAEEAGELYPGLFEVDFKTETTSMCAFSGPRARTQDGLMVRPAQCVTLPTDNVQAIQEPCVFMVFADGSGNMYCGSELDQLKGTSNEEITL